eukprot:787413-Prymnesium_polylepis.1
MARLQSMRDRQRDKEPNKRGAQRDAHEPALHRATNGHDARARPGFHAACSQGMMGDQPGTTGRAG